MQKHSMKRIMVTIPPDLLYEVEKKAKENNSNRSRLIRESLRIYLDDLKKRTLREELKEFYLLNAERDRQIAEEFSYSDYELEKKLAKQEEK